ncbi:hypothetical protein [Thiothrix unzii]|jgi:hypothetical protein|uniref:hypothetical protein n=1 Tax=Thiothrix unzii TaxID=111769 RepID=UPI002A35B8BC|nr:hypothetical protein [Thiothrix unzii]MDX9988335.1 hypothetical protein [Thiothrix unzii]
MKSFNFSKDTAAIFDAKARAIRAYNLMQWARWATFGLYIVAVFMLYVSDVWGIASYLEKNSNEYIALGVFSITSFALSYFLASSKEAVYEDIALNRSEGFHMTWGQRFAMTLFASAGILFELFSATSNQQHISNNAAEQAGLLKPAVVGSVAINTPPALAETLMKAQANLNNCGELLKQGRVKDCQFSQGKVTGAERAIQMANETAVTINGDMVDKTNAHNEKLLERFDKPMFKVVGKAVGGDTHDGMLVAVAVMITIFELQHILAVFAYGNALRRMNADKLAKRPEDETRPAAQALPGSAFNSAKQTVNEYATKAAENIATENAKAQYARANAYNVAGDALDNAVLKVSGGFKQSPEQRQNALNLAGMANPASALTSTTYRQALRNGSDRFEDMPLDQLTHTAATLPHDQHHGRTGARNPALGTAEEHFSIPLSSVATPPFRCLNSVVDNENSTTAATSDNGGNENPAMPDVLEKVAFLEQKIASQKAEMEAKQREADNERQQLQVNAQAKLEAERDERNRAEAARESEIRQREAAAAQEARQREDAIRQRAEEAAATAARELAAAEALAAERAERGALTDEQIELATAVIRTAIVEGHIKKVGTPQVSPILKAAGLPTGAEIQRVLHKLACKQLEVEKLVIQNPNRANGQPLYLIA